MRKMFGAGLLTVLAILFLIANRGAYEGYFHGDDLLNILWTTKYAQPPLFLKSYASPQLMETNFRPVGHAFFYVAGRVAKLDFRWYVLTIHLIHFLNVWLLWRLVRKAGLETWAAAAGALFFAFHMGAFDAVWKPMYAFDLLCATFCLLSLLAYANRRWVLSFVCFWTAYRAKEVAVMLPAVLLCWEVWLGKKEWKRLIPFFAVSASFGVQALLSKAAVGTEYALRFGIADIWKCAGFYASKFLLLNSPALAAGIALCFAAGLALLGRDRRVWFGLAGAVLFLAPMLVLPGRLYGAYIYVPLLGAAIAVAAVAERARPVWLVPSFFLLWVPLNYAELRVQRKATLHFAQDSRAYVERLQANLPRWSSARTVITDGVPAGLNTWGADAALRLLSRPDLKVLPLDRRPAWSKLRGGVAVIGWDPRFRKLDVVTGDAGRADAAYVTIDFGAPFWQLGEGWYQREDRLCWIQPRALAQLRRPRDARQFELVAGVQPAQIAQTGPTHVEILLEGRPLGSAEFSEPGIRKLHWQLPPGAAGTANVEFRVHPPFLPPSGDPRTLGIAVMEFGFR